MIRARLRSPGWAGLHGVPTGPGLPSAGPIRIWAVWDATSGKVRLEHLPGWGALTGVRYSPDGRLLAVASGDRRVRIKEAATSRQTAVLEDYPEGLLSVAFAPHSPILATGGGDPLEIVQQPMGKTSPADGQPRSVRLWDANRALRCARSRTTWDRSTRWCSPPREAG